MTRNTAADTTAQILPSYLQDAWWTPEPAGAATVLRDASTGQAIAHVSTEGADLVGALEHARSLGQASLGELTFHQRALLLKKFALALTERKDELYTLSARTGATKADSLVDIDAAMELGYRHPMGPLRTTDVVGLDVRLAIAEYLSRELGERFEPPQLLRDMVLRGELGQKSGKGFYDWKE